VSQSVLVKLSNKLSRVIRLAALPQAFARRQRFELPETARVETLTV
jgi:hypothetical protein